jgi:hypothetical protein
MSKFKKNDIVLRKSKSWNAPENTALVGKPEKILIVMHTDIYLVGHANPYQERELLSMEDSIKILVAQKQVINDRVEKLIEWRDNGND